MFAKHEKELAEWREQERPDIPESWRTITEQQAKDSLRKKPPRPSQGWNTWTKSDISITIWWEHFEQAGTEQCQAQVRLGLANLWYLATELQMLLFTYIIYQHQTIYTKGFCLDSLNALHNLNGLNGFNVLNDMYLIVWMNWIAWKNWIVWMVWIVCMAERVEMVKMVELLNGEMVKMGKWLQCWNGCNGLNGLHGWNIKNSSNG